MRQDRTRLVSADDTKQKSILRPVLMVAPLFSQWPAATHASTNPVSRLRRPNRSVGGPTTRSYSGADHSKLKSPINIASVGIGGFPPLVQPAAGSGWPPR